MEGPPQLLRVAKRIPVAAGLGGGSADAAAALRLLARRSGLRTDLHALATWLGADVQASSSLVAGLSRGSASASHASPIPIPAGS